MLESGWGDKILQGRAFHSWKWGKYEYNKIISWAGELAQQLGTFAAFIEDHSLIPSTHIGWITTKCNLALEIQYPFLASKSTLVRTYRTYT